MRQDRLVLVMLKELKTKNTITVFGMGQRVSNFIEINKLLKKVELFLEGDNPGIYNVGGENISYADLACRLIDKYGDSHSRIIKCDKGSTAKFNLDTGKLSKVKG